MLRKNAWIVLLFFAVCLPSTLWAQEMMHGKWWLNQDITKELNLTDSERQVLDKKYIQSRRRLIDLKSALERERFELELLLDTSNADKEKILERYESVERARSELSKERFRMLMDVRETLGAERFYALKSMHRDRKDKRKRYKEDKTHWGKERD